MRKHKADYSIVLATGLLVLLGLLLIYSISPVISFSVTGDSSKENYYFYRQLFNIFIATIAFVVAANIKSDTWKRLLPYMIIASAVSSLIIFIPGLGIETKGATRWIELGPLSFQPSELIKLVTILYLAYFFASKDKKTRENEKETFWPLMLIFSIISFVVVVLQKDLGTMMVIASVFVCMMYAGGIPNKQMLKMFATLGVGLFFSILLFRHRVERLLTFLDPSADAQGSGYHILQALVAVGSGGWTGLGLGRSVQVYGYLPESASDSIFAVWAEKFGFLGSIILLGLFGYLIKRLYDTAINSKDESSKLICLGITVWIASQTFINIGAMLRLIPLKGITLPFISYGGSSLIFVMFAVGIVFQFSKYSDRKLSPTIAPSRPQRRNRVVSGNRLRR